MPTRPETMAFLLDQLSGVPGVRTRRMFGEYCVYLDDKPTAFVCDDQLLVKITDAGRALLTQPVFGQPYPGAKPYFLLRPDEWEARDALQRLLTATAAALPAPRPRAARKPRRPKPCFRLAPAAISADGSQSWRSAAPHAVTASAAWQSSAVACVPAAVCLRAAALGCRVATGSSQ